MPALSILHTTFNLRLTHNNIESFRGAISEMAGIENNLFHNHNTSEEDHEKFIYRYPLIQYRVHDGYATIFAVNEGVEALEKILKKNKLSQFNINGRKFPLEITKRFENASFKLSFTVANKLNTYRIYKYIPFNPENYHKYKELPHMRSKIEMLEKLMANHILSFAKTVNWKISKTKKINVIINDLDRVSKVQALAINMMAFDMVFSCNLNLPDRLSLGRKTAYGFGWIFQL